DVPGDAARFDRAVEAAITERYGFVREVISRTPAEVSAALAAHPFEVVDPKFSYITFLTATPAADALDAAANVPTGDDEWQLAGRELHLRFAGGMGRAVLNLDRLLRSLGVAGTARNLRTTQALVELAG
ncbi:MAG TPA: DUF1697 domain-containing protein, partial [Rhodoglobus sp.]|nr:DUF1697 domain-containing protein [Rhodoglobus sp.]